MNMKEDKTESIKGSCLCGAVTFELTEPPAFRTHWYL